MRAAVECKRHVELAVGSVDLVRPSLSPRGALLTKLPPKYRPKSTKLRYDYEPRFPRRGPGLLRDRDWAAAGRQGRAGAAAWGPGNADLWPHLQCSQLARILGVSGCQSPPSRGHSGVPPADIHRESLRALGGGLRGRLRNDSRDVGDFGRPTPAPTHPIESIPLWRTLRSVPTRLLTQPRRA